MDLKKRQRFLINIAYLASITAIAYLVFKYLIGLIMPFLLALVFSCVLRPAVRFLEKKLRLRKNAAAMLSACLFFGLSAGLVVFIGVRLTSSLAALFANLPQFYEQSIEPGLQSALSSVQDFAARLDPAFMRALNDASPSIIEAAGDTVSGISGEALRWIPGFAARLPSFFVGGIVMVIATFFMALDYDRMTAFLMRPLPDGAREMAAEIKRNFINIVWRYGKSYSIILLITFTELTVGFLILGVGKAPLIALLIALFDIFPVLGTGMVLGPWAVVYFIQGKYLPAIGLIVLYLVVTLVRQVAEPRIVGRHVGLHPLATLICLFIGAKLFGVVGFFGLPITVAILNELAAAGTINLAFWRGAASSEKENSDSPPEGGKEPPT